MCKTGIIVRVDCLDRPVEKQYGHLREFLTHLTYSVNISLESLYS